MSRKNCFPPKWVTRFLQWICPAQLLDEIEGDLIEKFTRDVKMFGNERAKRRYLWNAVRFFRPEIIMRNKFSFKATPFIMFRHYSKIFFRTTIKDAGHSFINFSGLTVGLLTSILILLWVMDEISFDNFHFDKGRIFQVMTNHYFDTSTETYPNTPGPLAGGLKELPEVEYAFRTTLEGPVLFNYRDQSVFEKGVYADGEMFNVFNFPVLQGDISNPLPDNNSVAISKTLANKYFKGESAIGKVFLIDKKFDVKVTAVFQDLPNNSSIRFDFVMPYQMYARSDPYNDEWGAWTGGITYVKLHKVSDRELVNQKIASSFTKPRIWVRWDDNVELFLFPLADWRLFSNFENGKQAGGRIAYVRGFGMVALFILLIACINFMNLATARSVTRSREVAIRKVVGAGRRSLAGQFVGESILIAFISLVLALFMVHLLLPFFNDLTGKKLSMDYMNPVISGSLIAITLFTGLLAASYPAFVLSSLQALNVLKGRFSGLGGAGLRKGLVVFQFALSIIMIICTLAVEEQIRYMRGKNLGFDKENVLFFRTNDVMRKNFEGFRNEALANPAIDFVFQCNANPMDIFSEIVLADDAWPGKTSSEDISFKWLQCDYDFLPALGFTLLEGRNFSRDFPSDSSNYIISEEAARLMKLSNPVGQFLSAPNKGQIIGVVKNFHTTALQGPIEPVIIAMRPKNTNRIFIRYKSGKTVETLEAVKALCERYNPDYPMDYTFLDETFDGQYRNEIMIGKLASYFSLMAVFISGLGMFALASFMAVRRTKEIGVRKVMGATAWQMVVLLCGDFILLIGVSLAVGIPFGWWCMNKFLSGYEFHTNISISVFVLTASVMLLMALLTVSFQSAKAALANPVKSLRTE